MHYHVHALHYLREQLATDRPNRHSCSLCKLAQCAIISIVNEQKSLGLRERKLRETRHALELATIELTEQDGFDNVTIAQITERAGVSQRTFFNYFDEKADALIGMWPERWQDTVQKTFPRTPSPAGAYTDVKDFLIHNFQAYLHRDDLRNRRMKVLAKHPEIMQRYHSALHSLLEQFHDHTARLLAATTSPADTPPNEEHLQDAKYLLLLCYVAMASTLPAWGAPSTGDHHPIDLATAFVQLEETVTKYLPIERRRQ